MNQGALYKNLNHSDGFTLIELLVTLAVMTILLYVSVPAFSELQANIRLSNALTTIGPSLSLAQTANLGVEGSPDTVICASTDNINCNSTQWESGWIVFLDYNRNGQITTGDGDRILFVGSSLANGLALRTSGFDDLGAISYNRYGVPDSSGAFSICDNRGPTRGKAVIVSAVGHVRDATDDNGDGRVNLPTGELACP